MMIRELIEVAIAETSLRAAGREITPEAIAAFRASRGPWQPHPDDLSLDDLKALAHDPAWSDPSRKADEVVRQLLARRGAGGT
jgi:hypothetical protein